jgi:hypothetical protein
VNVVFVVPDEVTFKTVRIPAAQKDCFMQDAGREPHRTNTKEEK